MNRKGDWIQTYTGRSYWPADPRPEDVSIADIAHSLSNLCRYGGHCSRFYSVAEHSVLVSQLVPPEHALHGLLHDATEAYCADVPRPLKRMLANYAELELVNWHAIASAFRLDAALPQSVKDADNAILATEMDALMEHPLAADWSSVPGGMPRAANVTIQGWPPAVAERLFLDRFFELNERPAARKEKP
jgi:hypothetical protein